jgi:hypothetical protein
MPGKKLSPMAQAYMDAVNGKGKGKGSEGSMRIMPMPNEKPISKMPVTPSPADGSMRKPGKGRDLMKEVEKEVMKKTKPMGRGRGVTGGK